MGAIVSVPNGTKVVLEHSLTGELREVGPGVNVQSPLWFARSVTWNFSTAAPRTLGGLSSSRIPTNELCYDPEGISAITQDGVPVDVDLVLRFRVSDALRAVSSTHDLFSSLENLVLTATYEAVSGLALDALNSAALKKRMRVADLTKAAQDWGVTFIALDVQNFTLPAEIQDATVHTMASKRTVEAELAKIEQEHQRRLKMAATEQQEQDMRLNLHMEQMRHEANTKRLVADTEAYETSIRAKAEAEARKIGIDVETEGYEKKTKVKLERLKGKLQAFQEHPGTVQFYEHERLSKSLSAISHDGNSKFVIAPLDTLNLAARAPRLDTLVNQ